MGSANETGIKATAAGNRQRLCFLLAALLLAFFVRIAGIRSEPAQFHSTKQYECALRARAYYLASEKHRHEKEAVPALLFSDAKEKKDPGIYELLTAAMYRIAGKEDLLMPRSLSVLCWLAGGVFIERVAFLFFGASGAVFSLIVYLFFPFGINISLSIQPESLVNMFFLWAVLQIVNYFRSGQREHFYSAALLSGFAVLLKVTMIFPLAGMILFAGVATHGLKGFLFRRRSAWFLLIFFTVGLSFYLAAALWHPALRGAVSSLIIPGMLKSATFWQGWLIQIGKVTGVVPLLLGAALLFTIKEKETRSMLAGLLCGYLVYGIVFSYPAATHDYYQLALLPITALLLGQAGQLLAQRGKTAKASPGLALAVSAAVLGAAVVLLFSHQGSFMRSDHQLKMWSPAFFLVGEQGSFFLNNIPEQNIIEIAKGIGAVTGHGTDNIFLSRSYGHLLMYYGAMFGKAWPTEEDRNFRSIRGLENLSAERLYFSQFADSRPRFFIITDLQAWEKQPDLRKFLAGTFEIFSEKKGYIIFDLRKRKPKASGAPVPLIT